MTVLLLPGLIPVERDCNPVRLAVDMNSPSCSSSGDYSTEELFTLVYDELRKTAQNKMVDEGPQTLTATALVHEAYLRISKRNETPAWENQRQFFGAAAEAMRRILIDRARAKLQLKRGGKQRQVSLAESQIIAPQKDDELLALNEALEILEQEDPESAELAKFRYFAGMTWAEIVKATGTPERTLRRRWAYAKIWLQERIDRK